MFTKYLLGAASFFVAVFGAVAAYFKMQVQSKEIELKVIEKESAKKAVELLSDAQQAEHDAIQNHKRRSTDEINRAKSGDRSFFE